MVLLSWQVEVFMKETGKQTKDIKNLWKFYLSIM
jgi:hypothetical protein